MANKQDFEIDLNLRTEWSQQQRVIEQTQGAVEALADATAKANAEMASSSSGGDGRAYTAQMNQVEAVKRHQQAAADAAVSIRKEQAELAKLVSTIDPATRALNKLDAAQAQLDAHRKAGLVGVEDYQRFSAGIDAARTKVLAAGEGMHQFSLNSNMARLEMGRLLKDMATGQWGSFERTSLTLANYTGLMGAAFSATGLAVLGALGAVAAIVGVYESGIRQTEEFERALISTGGAAGVTAGQLGDMRDKVGDATGKFGDAQTALEKLTASGKLTGESLQAAATAAVNLSELTGESIDKTTSEIIRLADSPVKGMETLNDQYHFLTLSTYDQVAALEKQGDHEEAVRVLLDELARTSAQRSAEMVEHAGSIEKAWRGVWGAVLGALQAAKTGLADIGSDAPEALMRSATRGMENYRRQLHEVADGIRSGFYSPERGAALTANFKQLFDQNKAAFDAALKQRNAERNAAQGKADEQKIQDDGIKAAARVDREIQGIDKKAERQSRLNKLIEDYNQIEAADPNDKRLYDGSYDKLKAKIIADTEEKVRKARTARQKETPDEKAEKAAEAELARLTEQVKLTAALEDGEKKITEAQKMRYETTEGKYRLASQATKDALVAEAEARDKQVAAAEETKKHAEAVKKLQSEYDQLKEQLRTPLESSVGDATDRIKLLNDALAEGIGKIIKTREEYDRLLAATAHDMTDKQPEFKGLAPEVGGAYGEIQKLQKAAAEENKWYADALERQRQYQRIKGADLKASNDEIERIEAQHKATMAQIDAASNMAKLSMAGEVFGQIAQLSRSHNAKLATIGKAAAVAEATIQGILAVQKALASSAPPYSYVLAAAAGAAAAVNVANIVNTPTGYDTGGYTGDGGRLEPAGIVHKGEGVLNQREIAALGGEQGFYALRAAISDGQMRERLYGWAGYADGGFVSSGPRLSAPDLSRRPSAEMFAGGGNRLSLYNYFDVDALAQAVANHPATEKRIITVAGENGLAIRSEW
ncbi:MAG: phage tail length tape measure family protein [Proteobacteria bacterium]|nr:phage tail length tape measure family protein [Pseudomonadota bacterium]